MNTDFKDILTYVRDLYLLDFEKESCVFYSEIWEFHKKNVTLHPWNRRRAPAFRADTHYFKGARMLRHVVTHEYKSLLLKRMTTITLNIDNPSIVPSLRKILNALDGVTIAKTTSKRKYKTVDDPNDTTIAAMREIESGNDAGEVNLDSMESFIAFMQ